MQVPPVSGSSSPPSPSEEYWLTLDMAKELAMTSRSAKGREAQLYFIDRERMPREKLRAKLEAEPVGKELFRKSRVRVLAPLRVR